MVGWKIFNVSQEEVGVLRGGPLFEEFFLSKQCFLVRSLAVPFPHPRIDSLLEDARKALKPHKGLLSLPDEALAKIVGDPDFSLPDVVALAITCRRLFAVSAKAIGVARVECAARWAGGRIACVSEKTRYSDLPPAMLESHERSVIDQVYQVQKYGSPFQPIDLSPQDPAYLTQPVEPTYWSDGPYRIELAGPMLDAAQRAGQTELSIDDWPWGRLDHLCWGVSPELWRGAFDYIKNGSGWYGRLEGRDLERFHLVMAQMFPTHRKDWVLLNLSKMEYVTASAMATLSKHPDDVQPWLPYCRADLGHALLARICWASEDCTGLEGNPTRVERGPWAGDRFCITTMDRVAKQKKGEPQWKDVSHAVVGDVKKIFEAIYGDQADKVLGGGVWPGDTWYWFGSDGQGGDEVASTGRRTQK
ncbi:hypothetical protein LXA43DRAFT_490204 [Ganoderma leucocontextum]|nr:hypothetical protein LXA43DRAFT_490204 [Ganoderma leucocontextum]